MNALNGFRPFRLVRPGGTEDVIAAGVITAITKPSI
jgi:hypothetical protein